MGLLDEQPLLCARGAGLADGPGWLRPRDLARGASGVETKRGSTRTFRQTTQQMCLSSNKKGHV